MDQGIVGLTLAGGADADGAAMDGDDDGDRVSITVIDADDLLDHSAEVIEAFCREVGIDYTPDMLR